MKAFYGSNKSSICTGLYLEKESLREGEIVVMLRSEIPDDARYGEVYWLVFGFNGGSKIAI
jgi:hypothetical protein